MKLYIKDHILIINYEGNKEKMNDSLDIISNAYEGPLQNRQGHNFPSSYIPKDHFLSKYKNECKYVIGTFNSKSIKHELYHAKFFIDLTYKNKIIKEWNELDNQNRDHIIKFLKKLGYSDKVLIDEYQAYRYTEKENFFGIKLNH
jgi:hypothetical protein